MSAAEAGEGAPGTLGLHTLAPEVPRKRRKRVGRGPGSGHGKTSGRGTKGQKARSGGAKGPGFEGGQMPLQRRLPRRGFSNAPFKREFAVVNVGELARFAAGSRVDPDAMRQARLVRGRDREVKVLGEGEVAVPLHVSAHAFSREARRKIEAAGGTAEVIGGGRAADAAGGEGA
jgi:large subunit ribosomal protein L15